MFDDVIQDVIDNGDGSIDIEIDEEQFIEDAQAVNDFADFIIDTLNDDGI